MDWEHPGYEELIEKAQIITMRYGLPITELDLETSMEPRKFWMVWNENSLTVSMKHDSKESAHGEAERLARKHPGQRFYVLSAIQSCVVADVQWTHLQI